MWVSLLDSLRISLHFDRLLPEHSDCVLFTQDVYIEQMLHIQSGIAIICWTYSRDNIKSKQKKTKIWHAFRMMTQNVLMWQPLAHVGTCFQFYAIINFTDFLFKKMVRDNEKVWLFMEIVFFIMNNFSSFAKCTLTQIIMWNTFIWIFIRIQKLWHKNFMHFQKFF